MRQVRLPVTHHNKSADDLPVRNGYVDFSNDISPHFISCHFGPHKPAHMILNIFKKGAIFWEVNWTANGCIKYEALYVQYLEKLYRK